MMEWLNEVSQNLPAWVVSWCSIAVSFITAIGLPSIVACIRTYSKASVYLYNAKKLTKHQNELTAKHNRQNELLVSFVKTQIKLLEVMKNAEHNPAKKKQYEEQINIDIEYLGEFEQLKMDGVELVDKKQLKEMKKVKIVKDK